VERALRRGPGSGVGPYSLQAAIAAVHAAAPTRADTDWPRILVLYHALARVAPSPVVRLNRAVAVAEVHGPAAGLALVDELAGGDLDRSHLLPATRADLLRRLGRHDEAARAYRLALARVGAEPERRFLERRLASLGLG
jgi:RNA polymerase sigma-70 factor (ECF subfamily)